MKKFLGSLFYVMASIMTVGIAVYVGAITVFYPHAAPFGGYFNINHLLYLLGYCLVCAAFYYISNRLMDKK